MRAPTPTYAGGMPFQTTPLIEILSLFSIHVVVATLAVIHVLLNKRDSRAAFGWVALVMVFPLMGPLLYALFGINRVRRKAQRISQETEAPSAKRDDVPQHRGDADIYRPGYHITGQKRSHGNDITTYFNGEQAFPAMLESIDKAEHEVLLSSYIFDNDETGLKFIEAMARARQRGCRVCLLVDDAGLRYSFPSVVRKIKQADLPFRRFMPFKLIPPGCIVNLRTHRKILVLDRRRAYAGGARPASLFPAGVKRAAVISQ